MKVEKIPIDWHPDLPIFAKESFLKAVSDDYGWLGGFDEAGRLLCFLPYTIVRKAIFRMVRFRVETVPAAADFGPSEERTFLNEAIGFFRALGTDMIIPATTNTIFRTYPDGADAAPYGSYVIDLSQPEEALWKNLSAKNRQNINSARHGGVVVRSGEGSLEACHALIADTFKRSRLPFMNWKSFERYVRGLGDYARIMVADRGGEIQSASIYAFSDYAAYAVYGGNRPEIPQGAMKLVQWEAICAFKRLGVKRFDLVGTRIDPAKGSKQEALSAFKKRFGAALRRGYIWKYPLHPVKYRLYGLAARLRSGGDIVDAERSKMKGYDPSEGEADGRPDTD